MVVRVASGRGDDLVQSRDGVEDVGSSTLGMVYATGVRGVVGAGELATLNGRPLIAQALAMVSSQSAEVIVCGGHFGGQDDAARSNMSVLDALAAGIEKAIEHDLEAVFTCPYTLPLIPRDLAATLARGGAGPAIVEGFPLLGYWPIWLADELVHARETSPAMTLDAWATHVLARRVPVAITR